MLPTPTPSRPLPYTATVVHQEPVLDRHHRHGVVLVLVLVADADDGSSSAASGASVCSVG